jgi:hypothetical protein
MMAFLIEFTAEYCQPSANQINALFPAFNLFSFKLKKTLKGDVTHTSVLILLG